jgi:23S rRNA pseudouridine1911/1915/1917 synthase
MRREPIRQWCCPEHLPEIALDRYVRLQVDALSWRQARHWVTTGKISINGETVRNPIARVHSGDVIVFDPCARNDLFAPIPCVPTLFVDSQIVVVDKPPGISTVPYDKDERGTLFDRVHQMLRNTEPNRQAALYVIHRIDKHASGIVVFARTHAALLRMKQTFRRHDIERRYLALVYGYPANQVLCSRLVANRGDGKRGSTSNPRLGRHATTHVRSLERFESTTLVQCRLETGRTHQIRIQLAEAGFPLLGEPVYGHSSSKDIPVPRLMLHAAYLGFRHPLTALPLAYRSDAPEDMATIIERLRKARRG